MVSRLRLCTFLLSFQTVSSYYLFLSMRCWMCWMGLYSTCSLLACRRSLLRCQSAEMGFPLLSKQSLFLPQKCPSGLIFLSWFLETERGARSPWLVTRPLILRKSSSSCSSSSSAYCYTSSYRAYSSSSQSSSYCCLGGLACFFSNFFIFCFRRSCSILLNLGFFSPYASSSDSDCAWFLAMIWGAVSSPQDLASASRLIFLILKMSLLCALQTNLMQEMMARWARYFTSWCQLQIDCREDWMRMQRWGFWLILCSWTPFFCSYQTNGRSCSLTKTKDLPSDLYRAVLPTRWTQVSVWSGMSNWKTQSTMGKSSPLAAMLVQSSTPYLFSQKVKQMAMRFFCFWWPCSSYRGQPSLNFLRDSYKKRTCLQVETKTTTFCL